jgi:hypothetical protein
MKFVIGILMLFSFSAFAGFQAFNGEQDLNIFNKVKCAGGIECSKAGDKLMVQAGGSVVAATSGTLTSAQCGSTFLSSGAVEIDLPDASTVLGCEYTFIVGNASNMVIDPSVGDQILLLTDSAGDSITADAVGESVKLKAISANAWAVVGAEKGTWSDTN